MGVVFVFPRSALPNRNPEKQITASTTASESFTNVMLSNANHYRTSGLWPDRQGSIANNSFRLSRLFRHKGCSRRAEGFCNFVVQRYEATKLTVLAGDQTRRIAFHIGECSEPVVLYFKNPLRVRERLWTQDQEQRVENRE